jgi:hypothetical protein
VKNAGKSGAATKADTTGTIRNEDFSPGDADTGAPLVFTASGQSSSLQAQAQAATGQGADYKHWADKTPGEKWQNGALQQTNSEYFEGEVVPQYWTINKLTVGSSYALNIYYDYLQANTNACGFDYLATYNANRTTTFLGDTPTEEYAFPEGYGNFWTVDADITAVTPPTTAPQPSQRYVQVTFTANASTVEFYWGLHLAQPGANGAGCLGAGSWTGASLQTDVRDVPAANGATMLGGGGSLQINPAAVIQGRISGFKWNDKDTDGVWDDGSEGKLGGWTIYLCSEAPCSASNALLTLVTADGTGAYEFSVTPGTYYVAEELTTGWTQTYPASGYYGPLEIGATTPA